MNTKENNINIERDVNVHLENRRISRRFFWFLWIMYAIVCMTKNCYNGAMASIVDEGILTKSQTGFISAMFYLTYTPLQFLGGGFCDRYSPEKLIKYSLVGAAAANVVIYFNHNYYVMLAAWMLNGIVQFAIWPATFKIISSQLVRSDRKQMAFYISMSGTAGLVLSYLVAAFVPIWEHNFSVSALMLFTLAIGMHIYDKHLNKFMKRDYTETNVDDKQKSVHEVSIWKIMKKSGLIFVLISIFLFTVVARSRESLAPVLFMENYDNVSPSIGNLFNMLMIIVGLAGTIVARKFIVKTDNEVWGMILTLVAMLPFLGVCCFVGKISIYAVLVSLCAVAALQSMTVLFGNTFDMAFARYGKSGAVAGFSNGARALSYLAASYLMPLFAEKFGWTVLVALWPVFTVLAVAALCFAVSMFKRFKKIGL